MIRILALAPRPLWPAHDGGTVATLRCISGLAAAGAEVSVLSMETGKHDSVSMPTASKYATDIAARYKTVRVNTDISLVSMTRNLLFSGIPYDLERFRSETFAEALRDSLQQDEYDIIHCEGLVMALYLEEIRQLTDAPVVLRAHNLEHRIRLMMAGTTRSPLRGAYLRNLSHRLLTLELKAAQQFNAIVPISGTDFQWFSSSAEGKPVFLSETGTDQIGYLPEPGDGSLRVGFLGAMNWQPNIDGIKWFVDRVWPALLKKIPEATLHLAGRGIRQHSSVLLQGKGILIEGEPDDARDFIASNHVMISPLFAGSGLRIKIVEAMSAGRPVVATPVAAEGLPVEDGRELAIAADEDSFRNKLGLLLEQPGLRSAMAEAALKLVLGRYDNISNTARLLKFYKELVHGS